MRKVKIGLAGLALSLALAGCASNQAQQHVPYYVSALVTDIQVENKPSGWKTGTAVGAGAGLLTGRGHGKESKAYRAAGGALIGAALQKGLTSGSTTYHVQVVTERNDVFGFKHRDNNLKIGDCVQFDMNNNRAKLLHTDMNNCRFAYTRR